METTIKLKDGSEFVIRPQREGDLDQLFEFFRSMPNKDKRFLRYDVSRRDVLEERFRATETGRVRRLVAVTGDEIAADGLLELEGHGWKEHVGELRLFVVPLGECRLGAAFVGRGRSFDGARVAPCIPAAQGDRDEQDTDAAQRDGQPEAGGCTRIHRDALSAAARARYSGRRQSRAR